MSQPLELKPVRLYQWLVPQPVRSGTVDGERITLDTDHGRVVLELHQVTLHESRSWQILRQVTLSVPSVSYTLKGIWPGSVIDLADAINRAVRQVKERADENRRQTLAAELPKIRASNESWFTLMRSDRYVTNFDLTEWQSRVPPVLLPTPDDSRLIRRFPNDYHLAVTQFQNIRDNAREYTNARNNEFALKELSRYEAFFDRCQEYPLTTQQREIIVHDEDNVLVVAAAGSGKTSTIMAKVAYLINRGIANPDEILLLAYSRSAADDMANKIRKLLDVQVKVRTFHALGLEIIRHVESRAPHLSAESEDPNSFFRMIERLVIQVLSDTSLRVKYLHFMSMLSVAYRPIWEFKSMREYRTYLRNVEPRTLTGLLVRSYEECQIANWLHLKGISFEYEKEYEIPTSTKDRRQYRPDFYLPGYKIYIEHWGVDRNGSTGAFVNAAEYFNDMQWKREIHRENGTALVETYSWQAKERVLLIELEEQLRSKNVVVDSVDPQEALDRLNTLGVITRFSRLMGTFIDLFKTGGYSNESILKRASGRADSFRLTLFIELFFKVFEVYESRLKRSREIDFNDMIRRAERYVSGGAYVSSYKYIIVDEYQDISRGRFCLIDALRRQVRGAHLFCVGDDWQSIYRFTGADLALMTRFEEVVGFTRRSPLSHSFRFASGLAEVSSKFVMQNPVQISKNVHTNRRSEKPDIEVHLFEDEPDPIIRVLSTLSSGSSVLVIGRYKDEVNRARSLCKQFEDLKLRFDTAHGSKGLEDDYVIVMNVCSGIRGFPSGVSDDPVLEIVMAQADELQHGEERRLFYVAITRARKTVYLLAPLKRASPFIHELCNDPVYSGLVRVVPPSDKNVQTCQSCKNGFMLQREGPRGPFYGCTGYPLCEYTEAACSNCGKGPKWFSGDVAKCHTCGYQSSVCPECRRGTLVIRRRGTDGLSFYGCSRFTAGDERCSYTRPADAGTVSCHEQGT